MRCVVQRVTSARVTVDGQTIGEIGPGLAALIGVEQGDTEKDAQMIADKLAKLRIFADTQGKMNLSVRDVEGAVLAVSQFTLLGDARGQNRPGFTQAEEPERANALYELCCKRLEENGLTVARGQFRAHMQVTLTNDGPVTILLDSRKLF